MNNPTYGYLYLFRTHELTSSNVPIYKVGRSSRENLNLRLSEFTGKSKMSTLLYATYTKNHHALEQNVLQTLRSAKYHHLIENVHGEFFSCPDETAIVHYVKLIVVRWDLDVCRGLPGDSSTIASLKDEIQRLKSANERDMNRWQCLHCSMTFSTNSHWNRHMRLYCKAKKNLLNQNAVLIEKLKEQIQFLTEQNKKEKEKTLALQKKKTTLRTEIEGFLHLLRQF